MTTRALGGLPPPVRRETEDIRRLISEALDSLDAYAVPTAWTDVTFTNSWANFGGVHQPVQYRKVGDRVELRGLAAKPGAAAFEMMFTLPVGFRPPKRIRMNCVGSAFSYGVIDVETTGEVQYNAGSPADLSLDGIYFSVTA